MLKEQETHDDSKMLNDSNENTCVVCFKNVEIFSMGECDHPVCYECSTRMRVLCQQNECPICRQGLSKVIFTSTKSTYRELEVENRSELYNKKYKICFSTTQIQNAFYDLLQHPCPTCDCSPFPSFDILKDHVRKEHELFYCDICTENLKIFSFERKCYNRQELGMHRRKGDPDNKSHRGHPLCQYCDCRYLDRDELFRHLRREHFFCHFCDADGANYFYADYDSLRDHFRSEHYLCEEGDCAREQFTAVFRSEIDLKSHTANIHGKSLGKLLTKQARTLKLEITLGPSGRSSQHSQRDQNNTSRNRRDAQYNNDITRPAAIVQNPSPIIDSKSEQEFPSLGGVSSSITTSKFTQPAMSIRAKTFGPAGLARTKENFPALGGAVESGLSESTYATKSIPKHSRPPVSTILKKNTVPNSSMIIHVSNRPNKHLNNASNFCSQKDFPSLPSSSGNQYTEDHFPDSSNIDINFKQRQFHNENAQIKPCPIKKKIQQKDNGKNLKNNLRNQKSYNFSDDDIVPPDSNVDLSNISAKHRRLVDDYVSVAPTSNNTKIKFVKNQNERINNKTGGANIQLTENDFPALLGMKSTPQSNWVRSSKDNASGGIKKIASDNKRENNKVIETNNPKNNKKDNKKSKSNGTEKKLHDIRKLDANIFTTESKQSNMSKHQTKDSKSTDNFNGNKTINKNIVDKKKNVDGMTTKLTELNMGELNKTLSNDTDHSFINGEKSIATSGFNMNYTTGNISPIPPPGFKSVTLNSIARPPNDLTFTSSMGESYSIVPTHQYLPPANCTKRNQALVQHFHSCFTHPDAVDEFRHISKMFREGTYRAVPYYEHCQAALKNKFQEIFPELLCLLPDINKQQELFLVHSQRSKNVSHIGKNNNIRPKLEVCSTCKQVLTSSDLNCHTRSHTWENNFPRLSESQDHLSLPVKSTKQ